MNEPIHSESAHGAGADARLTPPAPPSAILFLDLDDVVCLNLRYGGYDVLHAMKGLHPDPEAVYREVFDAEACQVLAGLHAALNGGLRYVISSTWRESFSRDQLAEVFRRTGLAFVADALHEAWRTPSNFHFHPSPGSRLHDISRWLTQHHAGEAVAIVDDTFSGQSLTPVLTHRRSPLFGRVVLCDEGDGLLPKHTQPLLDALRRPMTRWQPERV